MSLPQNPPLTGNDLITLLESLRIDSPTAHSLFEKTALAYASESRFYHTLEHIEQVLAQIDFILKIGYYSLTIENLLALKLAAWFHDVVYDPRRSDNEEQSAMWMAQTTETLNLPASLLTTISHLILATRNHLAFSDDLPAQILLDADLSILGAPPKIYARYASAIRQEYAFVPEDAYRAGRRAVLERFLARPKIYHTILHEILERNARSNVTQELNQLV